MGVAASPPPVNERCFSGCALTFDGGTSNRIYSQSDFMHIGVTEAWAATHGDPNMLVAVVDTDVDAAHPDLAGKTGEWMRHDPAVVKHIEADGYFGLGKEVDEKWIKENFK